MVTRQPRRQRGVNHSLSGRSMFAFWMCVPIGRNTWYTGLACTRTTDCRSGEEEIPQGHVTLPLQHRMSVLSSGACRVLELQEIQDELLSPVN